MTELLAHMYDIEDPFEWLVWYVCVNKILYYYPEMFSKWQPVNDRAYDEFELH